jgi:peptide/nickel transport system permease protein
MKNNYIFNEGVLAEGNSRISEFRRFLRVLWGRKVVAFGIVVVILFLVTAIFAPLLSPYDPYEQQLKQRLLPPSSEHLLGTDDLGRDTFSRIIYGSRNALIVGVISVSIAATAGIIFGLIGGYYGGWLYSILMRFVDTLMCFPSILLALVIAALLGGGMKNVMIAVGISLLPGYARLTCGEVLSVKETDYVVAEHAMGANNLRIMILHVLPNCIPPLIVLITMQMGAAILAEAGLSFIGVGIEPPAASWGIMVNDGRSFLQTDPIMSFAPGLAIMLVIFGFSMVGDGLRDALDPRLRGAL